jgi:hypothetical protein
MAAAKAASTSSMRGWTLSLKSAFRMKYQNSVSHNKKGETTYRCSGDQSNLERGNRGLQSPQAVNGKRGDINDIEKRSNSRLLGDERLERVENGRPEVGQVSQNLWNV